MTEEPISVIDAARAVGFGKQSVFRILQRLGIDTFRERSRAHNGQAIAYISASDFALLRSDIASRLGTTEIDESADEADDILRETGVFYLLQLEPEHDPGRFKLGFAANIAERVRSHRCAAPFATVMKTWPCKRVWERTAIDCATAGCDQLHTEVFRTDDLDAVVARCDRFFEIMPSLNGVNAESGVTKRSN